MSIPTGSHLCPRSLDCARAGRHFCQPGNSHCGACLRPLVENSHGRCVVRRRHAPHATQSTKGKWLFQFYLIGPSHLVFMALCCNKHKIIFHVNLTTKIFYWPSVLFRKTKLLGTMRLLRYMIFILEKKIWTTLWCSLHWLFIYSSKYSIIYIVLHIYLILYVMTPLVAKLPILNYCISYHHQ